MTDTASSAATSANVTIANTGEVSYIVLQKDDSGFWSELKPTEWARTAEAAVKAAADREQKPAGTYVAIPRRSWKPVKVTAKVETTLVVEEAS